MRLDRSHLLARLEDFALSGHGVITGAPGVGKTVAVSQVSRRLMDEGRGVFLVNVSDLGTATEADISAAIPTAGDLLEALHSYFGTRQPPHLVVVDGFDAARNPEVRGRVLRLIRRMIAGAEGRWNVVVTVRSYDAARSPDLLALFSAKDENGVSARQFEVPRLAWEEVEAAVSPVEGFQTFLAGAPSALRELLRLPFNLWLVEQVMGAGGEAVIGELSRVETENQLLERFWEARVSKGGEGPSRGALTARAARAMATSETLAVPTNKVWAQESSAAWNSLLSAEVLTLTGPAESRVAFGHNTLFDFATSLYVLSPVPSELRDFLAAVPFRAFFLRPSLVFLFLDLWEHDRLSFWRLFKGLAGAGELPVRLVARLIPTYVLASEATSVDELRRLRHSGWHDQAQILLWAMQAARFAPDLRCAVWAEFTADLLDNPDPVYAWEATVLLRMILSRSEAGASAKREEGFRKARAEVARGAISLLDHALARRSDDAGPDGWWDVVGSRRALPLVIDTMGDETEGAAELIRSVLRLFREDEVPLGYALALSQGIKTIVDHAPGLAAEVYRTVFSHREASEAPTALGGAVLRLQGTRRQDYESAQYGLVRAYPHFVESAPVHAIRGGLFAGCMDVFRDGVVRHVDPQRLEEYLSKNVRPIVLGDARGEWIEDQSSLWPRSGRDDGVRLITAAAKGLVRLAQEGDPRTEAALRAYVENASVSLAVARLLGVGAEHPSALAVPLRGLALQTEIQVSLDLRESLGRFLESATPFWGSEERREVELSILQLETDPEVSLSDERRSELINQLLGAIPSDHLVTPAAQERRRTLEGAGGPPSIEPPIQFEGGVSEFTREDWLTEQGVDPEKPANKALRERVAPLEDFGREWRNKRPSEEAVAKVEEALDRAVEAVRLSQADDLVLNESWTAIAAVAATIARMDSFGPSDSRWDRVRQLLDKALGRRPSPVDATADESFEWPHWSPSPRSEAIQGLGYMLWTDGGEQVVDQLERVMVNEPDPALRYLAIRQALGIYRLQPERYWVMARTVAEHDRNVVTIATLLHGLGQLARSDGQEVRRVMELIWPRWRETEHRDVVQGVARVLLALAAYEEDAWARSALEDVRAKPFTYGELLNQVLFQASARLNPDNAPHRVDPNIARLRDIVIAGIDSLTQADSVLRARQAKGEIVSDERGSLHRMVDTVATRLDVNLRFRAEDQEDGDPVPVKDDEVVVHSYFSLVWPIIEKIVSFGEEADVLLAPTAHHLLELFNAILKVDPAVVVQAANRTVQVARGDSYNLDSLAIREVVKLMETVLADHRDILLEESPMVAVLELLDAFAESGWTEALELIWRLDEAFR